MASDVCKWHWLDHVVIPIIAIFFTWRATSQSNDINRERLLMDESGWLEAGDEFRLTDRLSPGTCTVDSAVAGENLGEFYPVFGLQSTQDARLTFTMHNTGPQPVKVILEATGELRTDSAVLWDALLRNPKEMNIILEVPEGPSERAIRHGDSLRISIPVAQDAVDSGGYSEIQVLVVSESQPFGTISLTYLWVETMNQLRTPQGIRLRHVSSASWEADMPIKIGARLLTSRCQVLKNKESREFHKSWRTICEDDSLNKIYRLKRLGHFE